MGKKFNGFVLGAAVGSIAALLFAPKSGKELRQNLSSKANEATSDLKGKKHEEIAEEVTSRLQEQTDMIARQLQEARMETAAGDLTPEESMQSIEEEEIVIPVSDEIVDEMLVEEQEVLDESVNDDKEEGIQSSTEDK